MDREKKILIKKFGQKMLMDKTALKNFQPAQSLILVEVLL